MQGELFIEHEDPTSVFECAWCQLVLPWGCYEWGIPDSPMDPPATDLAVCRTCWGAA